METQQRRVQILCRSPLFAASLKTLLEKEEGLEVVIEKYAGLPTPGGVPPHVLIVEEDDALSPEERDCVQADTPTVIRLSLKDNAMRVSYEQRISSATGDDLLQAVKSEGLALRASIER